MDQLNKIVAELEKSNVPEAIIGPTLEKCKEMAAKIPVIFGEAMKSGKPEAEMAGHKELIGEVTNYAAMLKAQIDDNPWADPSKLKATRETEGRLFDAMSKLIKHHNKMFGAPQAECQCVTCVAGRQLREESSDYGLSFKVSGVVHAAGVQYMRPFSEHTPSTFYSVWGPKVDAAFNMHQQMLMH
eukprot:gnl/TRDRNA2_/TRDRNA2_179425_c0_seq1.p1 gnl/TRDRNA2_/TRDRNA2_179425_c0~~gnl/TRDRNA2_/TRDRNA2_179425_c0_seq1.p1  ORF type:complete len:185 (+),score=49.98 gnl/TRDRNA2_/TRDRNA2_179425_c0_seq1:92-646(+)